MENQRDKIKKKILKIFFDNEVIEKCCEYEIVFIETNEYPYYNRLANYTANDSSTKMSMDYLLN